MQSPLSPRKRGGPGAHAVSPQPPQAGSDFGFSSGPDMTNSPAAPYIDWNAADAFGNFNPQYGEQPDFDSKVYDPNVNASLGFDSGASLSTDATNITSQLVRRNPNQQLATKNSSWQDGRSTPKQPTQGNWEDEDELELEQRALAAKRDALAKKKQIPPFVQKLSSFLDKSNNTDLIRWSDDGRSFIVLDEDEFAKTLIPELFKHNNYASFVRQLNMYGFHKKVGLSDNSMKASENKRKTPSEYWNKYFRRGRPELLWLIQKPKNPPPTKRKRDEGKKGDDSEDEKRLTVTEAQGGNDFGSGLSQDLAVIPKTELTGLRNELVTLQRQQKLISSVIGQIKRQNDQLYQQATAFQALHDRHESSINAILTFLATFYNRSLEGHGSATVADMFSHAISQTPTQQGNIVDMGDLTGVDLNVNSLHHGQTPSRRRQPLALLPAPDAKPSANTSAAAPVPGFAPGATKSQAQNPAFRPHRHPNRSTSSPNITQQQFTAHSPATVKTEGESPSFLGDTNDIMSVINAANATTPVSSGPNFDFNSALEHYQTADGHTPLTPQRRNEVLNLIANTTNAGSSTIPAGGAPPVENALTNPNPPPMPSLAQISQTQDQLDMLQRLQEEQAAKVQGLAERLGPLSPSGVIPGFHDAAVNGTPVPPPDWSLDDWIDPDSNSFDWQNANFDVNANFGNDLGIKPNGMDGQNAGTELNGFNLGGTDQEYFSNVQTQNTGDSSHVESVSSSTTSPALRDDGEDTLDMGSPRKRRRMGGSR